MDDLRPRRVPCTRNLAHAVAAAMLGLLCLGLWGSSAAPGEGEAMWLWQEGEHYTAQRGSTGADRKRAATRGVCLGSGWGASVDHYAEYPIEWPRAADARLILRYAREFAGSATLQVRLDGEPVGGLVGLESTGGWGDDGTHWRWHKVALGRLAAGQHAILLEIEAEASNVNIDGFFIADPRFGAPPDTDALRALLTRRLHETVAAEPVEVRTLLLPPIARKEPVTEYRSLRDTIAALPDDLRYVIEKTARKANCYLLKAFDVGQPTKYASDFVWHDLRKEKAWQLPFGGCLGVVNPNSDLNYLIGFASGGGRARFHFPASPTLHLIDALGYRCSAAPRVEAQVTFIPVAGDTLQVVVALRNTGPGARTVSVVQAVARQPLSLTPSQRYGGVTVTAGRMRWAGHDPGNDVAMAVLDEWTPAADERVGALVATLAASEPSASVTMSDEPNGKPWSDGELGACQVRYEVKLPARGERVVVLALNMRRFSEHEGAPTSRGTVFYPKETEAEAMAESARLAVATLGNDWRRSLRDRIARYRDLPVIALPRPTWIADYYACLELPRANTFSPWGTIKHPYYNFCRAHGHEPYGWWSYGMHGHEHLSTFVTNVTRPELSAFHLRGHFQNQSADGGFPYGVNHQSRPGEHTSGATCPFIAWEAWTAYLWSGDRDFLRDAYQACLRDYGDFWLGTRDRTGEGLVHWANWWETVRDDPDLPTWTLSGGAEKQEALDLNCYLLVVERTLAEMARELGNQDEERAYLAAADKRVRLMNAYMWDARDRCYYGISEIFPDDKVNVKDISTLFPLWAGLATAERADALVAHLQDPASLGTAYPVPTLAKDEPLFGAQWHWHGSNWVEMSWLPILGLQRYGYYDEAARLAEINTRMVFDTIDKISHFREYFNSITGEGVGLYDYIWTAMPAIFITQIFFGIEPTAVGLRVMPALPEGWDDISIGSLKVRGRRVSVRVTRDPKATETRAKVNGRTWPVEGGRGVFVPWDKIGRRVSVDIVQPTRIAEIHQPPWPLPHLDHPRVPPHPRLRDQALIDATRADADRAHRELKK
ncbi:hypothetical protein AMK68_01360 [candidate division KD3-62 bacterium DG_56]|uniref:CBM6 domain-containing protein n=1 Tax=candidate division KD3-62 bacterium DG_56 TaxID=1704032 RepID=A0A0S7XQA2_9BACT|nr:MAG: hypothetical protein AMK68_01360 [candidate division KD3-62 bacterium DG_56]